MKAIMGITVATAMLFSSQADATTLAKLTTDQMTDASDRVVRGTIADVWTVEVEGYMWTRADLVVTAAYKGANVGEHLMLESPGGSIEDRIVDVEAAARYSIGEDVLTFLVEHPARGTFGTVGMYLGKYTVRQNPDDGTDMLVRFTVSHEQPYDHRFIPHPDRADRVALPSMEATVRARVDLGWDGKPIPGADPARLRAINNLQPGVR